MPAICVTELKYISPIATDKSYMAFMPAVVVAAGIAVLSLAESTHMPAVQVSDKLAHGVMYCVLAATLMGGWVHIGRTRWMYYLLTCVLATSYGTLMEILQRFCTLTRSGQMADLYADAVGALIGVIIVCVIAISRDHVTTNKSEI